MREIFSIRQPKQIILGSMLFMTLVLLISLCTQEIDLHHHIDIEKICGFFQLDSPEK